MNDIQNFLPINFQQLPIERFLHPKHQKLYKLNIETIGDTQQTLNLQFMRRNSFDAMKSGDGAL